MKKLFVFFIIMAISVTLWAAKWQPKDPEKVLEKYEVFIQTFSQQEYGILLSARLSINKSLRRIQNIELYDEDGLLIKSNANEIEKELMAIGDLYNATKKVSENVSKALGTLIVFQTVKTKDDPYLGRLDEVFLKFANLNIYIDENLAHEQAKICNNFQSDYNFIAAMAI